jgi:hypothetical protein
MNFTDIVDINAAEQRDNLLTFMHTRLTDEQQRIFVKSFYMTLFDTGNKYPISEEEAIKWLGFTRKSDFKRLLEKHLTLNEHYITIIIPAEEQDKNDEKEVLRRSPQNPQTIEHHKIDEKVFLRRSPQKYKNDENEVLHRPVQNPQTIEHHKIDEKVFFLRPEGNPEPNEKPQKKPSRGRPCEKHYLTVDGFKLLAMKAGTNEGDKIRMYYIELEKQIFSYGMWQSSQKLKEKELEIENKTLEISTLAKQNEKLIEENRTLEVKTGTPVIYIYETDSRVENSDKKIGMTDSYRNRAKPFGQTHPYGRLVFKREINPNYNLRTCEGFVHLLLKDYKLNGENFSIRTEDAKMVINRVANTIELCCIKDIAERQSKFAKLLDYETQVIHDIPNPKLSTAEISTQTDYIQDVNSIVLDENKTNFDKYIEDWCIIQDTAEVSTKDIIGQYRLSAKSADKQTYQALMDYLNVRFRPIRMKTQNENSVINGFRGVMLREIEYKRKHENMDSKPELFVFGSCNFSPSGKVLMSEIIAEYNTWRKRMDNTGSYKENDTDIKELKLYLKNCEYILIANIWSQDGNGQGYYGISLKSNENYQKKTSSTAKKVEKRDCKTDTVLNTWATIAKAAEENGVCAAKLSRSIKNNIKIGDCYYVVSNT